MRAICAWADLAVSRKVLRMRKRRDNGQRKYG